MSEFKEVLLAMFRDVFETSEFDEAVIDRYFHDDYVQFVNDQKLDRDHFVRHMRTLHQTVSDMKIEVQHLVSEGDTVCSVHYSSGVKETGQRVKGKVAALWMFLDGKIVLCDELTCLTEGTEEDRDLGSRH